MGEGQNISRLLVGREGGLYIKGIVYYLRRMIDTDFILCL